MDGGRVTVHSALHALGRLWLSCVTGLWLGHASADQSPAETLLTQLS